MDVSSITSSNVYSDALNAWSTGDFETCVAICEGGSGDRVVTLQARALHRLLYHRKAIELVSAATFADPASESALVAAAIRANAHLRLGETEQAWAVLDAIDEGDRTAASAVAQAEIALAASLGHYKRGEFDRAEAVLDHIGKEAGVRYASALQSRAFIARLRGNTDQALSLYEQSLEVAAEHSAEDPSVEAQSLTGLGILAVELIDRAALTRLLARATDIPILGYRKQLMWWALEYWTAGFQEAYGDPREALAAARRAAEWAPSPALRLACRCRRAAILKRYGEELSWEDAARTIYDEYMRLDIAAFRYDDETAVRSVVIEVLALLGDHQTARSLLPEPPGSNQRWTLDALPERNGYFCYVEGLIAETAGDMLSARHRYREAFKLFKDLGFKRRTSMVALRLGTLTGEADVLNYARETSRALAPSSWIRRQLAVLSSDGSDSIFASLTRAEREVLGLLCQGKSTGEIAATRGRSPQTIRNTVSRLFTAFGVDNRLALLNECTRRRLFESTRPLEVGKPD